MTVVARRKLLGDPVDRVDGPLKVTGATPYPSDVTYPDLVHAALVQSKIGAGTIRSIEAGAAEAAPGVLAVITHENVPSLAEGPVGAFGPSPPLPLRATASCITASTSPWWWPRPASRRLRPRGS